MDGAENINSNVDLSRLRSLQHQKTNQKGNQQGSAQYKREESPVNVRLSPQAREALKERGAEGQGEDRFDASKVERARQKLSDWQGLEDEQLDAIAARLSETE